jgi:hypothetical protein
VPTEVAVDTGALSGDEIRLTIPAAPGYERVARVSAGALAARLGFSYQDVEEVRRAVDAAWEELLADDDGDAIVEVTLGVLSDGLTVDLALRDNDAEDRSVHLEKRAAAQSRDVAERSNP